jgi:hypothetical protein
MTEAVKSQAIQSQTAQTAFELISRCAIAGRNQHASWANDRDLQDASKPLR